MNQNQKSRPLNVSYLVVGLVFLGIAGAWALRTSGAVDTAQVQWLIPLVLVGAGAVGLVAFAAKGRSHGRRETSYDDPAIEDTEEPAFDPYDSTEPTTSIEGDHR